MVMSIPSGRKFPIALSILRARRRYVDHAQGIGDIYQLYTFTRLRGGDFNLAYIPGDHLSAAKEPFDPAEMRKLFDLGFEEARRVSLEKGPAWTGKKIEKACKTVRQTAGERPVLVALHKTRFFYFFFKDICYNI
jgi:hypothetical protein